MGTRIPLSPGPRKKQWPSPATCFLHPPPTRDTSQARPPAPHLLLDSCGEAEDEKLGINYLEFLLSEDVTAWTCLPQSLHLANGYVHPGCNGSFKIIISINVLHL